MAELPQIPIAPQTFQSRELSVPVNTELTAIRNTALIADRQINNLTDIVMKHQQSIEDRKAVNELFDASSNIQNDAADIKHIPTAISAFSESMVGAQSDIIEKYPNLSDVAKDELSRITDKKIQSFRYHALVKQNQQNQTDIAAVIPDTIRLIGEAQNVEDRNEQVYRGLNFIDKMKNTGAIDDAQVEVFKHQLVSATRQAEANELTALHPTELMGMSPEELGLPMNKYNEVVNRAIGNREHKMVADDLQRREENAAFTNQVLNGQYSDNPAMLENLRAAHKITEETYRAAQVMIPPDDRVRNNLERVIADTPWTEKDLVEFRNNWIRGNHTLSAEDHAYLMGQVENRMNEVKDPQSRKAFELYTSLKDYGAAVGTGIIDNGRYIGPEKKQYYDLISLARDRFMHSKDYDSLFKTYTEFETQLDKMFHVGERIVPRDGKPHSENVMNNWERASQDPEVQ